MSDPKKFESWCLVELFGHQRIVGLVTEQSIGGSSFIRVDVPAADGSVAFSRMYGAAAIYSISPIERETAIALAQRCDAVPVKAYELPEEPARLAAGPVSGASEPRDDDEELQEREGEYYGEDA